MLNNVTIQSKMHSYHDLFTGETGYRLGDMIMRKEARRKWRDQHLSSFPSSLASRYLRETDESFNVEVLEKLVGSYRGVASPSDDILVVHLRVGDVLDRDYSSENKGLGYVRMLPVDDFLSEQRGWPYIRPISHFRQAGQEAKKLGAKRVVIMAGSHFPQFSPYPRSMEYIRKIKKMFEEELKLPCKLRLGKKADVDFVFLSRAKLVTLTGGNFSVIAYLLASRRGAKVFGGIPKVRDEDKQVLEQALQEQNVQD